MRVLDRRERGQSRSPGFYFKDTDIGGAVHWEAGGEGQAEGLPHGATRSVTPEQASGRFPILSVRST